MTITAIRQIAMIAAAFSSGVTMGIIFTVEAHEASTRAHVLANSGMAVFVTCMLFLMATSTIK